MKTRFLLAWTFALALILAAGGFSSAWCQANTKDMALVRINDINEMLDIIDEWGADISPGQAVTLPVRAMMGNTDWIDPRRSAVAMVHMEGETPIVYGLVPYIKSSQVFQQLTQAQAGPDHYLVVYPPMGPMPADVAQALKMESVKKSKDSLFMEIPASVYIAQMEESLSSALNQAAAQSQGQVSAQDMQLMSKGLMDIMKQLKSLGIGVSLTRSKAALSFEGTALPGTKLAKALAAPPEGEARLANYRPSGEIQYRSRPYNVAAFMDVVNEAMGPFYQRIGIDMPSLLVPMQEMTGEYAAGLVMGPKDFALEAILCIKNPDAGSLLIDRMIDSIADAPRSSSQLANAPGAKPWKKTSNSKIAGLDVRGMSASVTEPVPGTNQTRTQTLEIRMAALDDMVLMASSDSKLRRLISKAKSLRPGKASGPFFTMDMDLGEIMRTAAENDPSGKMPKNIPSAQMRMTMDMSAGMMRAEMAMDPNDIKRLASAFPTMGPGGSGASMQGDVVVQPNDEMFQPQGGQDADAGEYVKPETEYAEPELTPEELLAQQVAAEVEKGNLSAIYGGPNAALKSYKKALDLNPESPAAHFAAALAYAELKNFNLALDHTEKALAFSPDNPVYMYGKARILLLSGSEDAAMEAFVTAANSGSEDAQNYLDHLSMEP